MIELLNAKIDDVEALVRAGVALMALVMVAMVWARTKSFVPTIGALLMGALVVWGVNNVEFLEQKVGQEFNQGSAPLAPSMPATALHADV